MAVQSAHSVVGAVFVEALEVLEELSAHLAAVWLLLGQPSRMIHVDVTLVRRLILVSGGIGGQMSENVSG